MSHKQDDRVVAVVQKVVEGRHGPYAVASSRLVKGPITFSLGKDVWQERRPPEEGTQVILEDVHKKSAGWRAEQARYYRPSDEGGAEEQ
ncbi:MAG: hypothetical protein A3B10_00610 [Candidatus Doudnabacteria bacterium RIFCSPLOWO2_01_FULL_44_21]|uniref:Uncharacterized protein n=1 Tax=Candidatus Doudnabacteria bacterium RIFCSPLOWO2_01_FULL_44_21 TaxID=1817841 RepID=A0A1F5PYH9_9BACT|nr:MAG: hypothetical protein A3B10_00610 [Candidatus Doudnabacteria bacterium RIFCSPLOWO2_01_FULL_44_21]